ncbi:MAG: MMPL family transporter [Planctomycetota bacterium]|nr:MMPL family transporter [Planctomycetota bacterium]
MISSFYQRNSLWIIGACLLSLAVLHPLAESIPPNNNTETWLADGNQAQSLYEDFRYHFGGEELILITLNRHEHDPAFIEVLCRRLEGLDEIRSVWSPARFAGLMTEFGVDGEQIPGRLNQVAISKDGQLAGLAAMLTPAGLEDRAATMSRVTDVLEYCSLAPGDVHITGAPAIIAELDRLGGKQANQNYFGLTILICLGVLWMTLRQLAPSVLILASTIWAFQLTLAIVYLWGGEMNFILDSLPVMIMVFTMAIAIHYLYHHAGHLDSPDPVGNALRSVSWPCFLAMLTTGIGLASLGTSSIPPVRQFGIATAGGTIAALIAGLVITPAILTRYPPVKYQQKCWARWFEMLSDWLQPRSKPVAALVSVGVVGCACGLWWLEAEFQPLNFFPESSKVLQDTRILREQMANTDSVEVVIDFGNRERTETQRVDIVRDIEQSLLSLDRVPVVLSATTWLPDPMPQGFAPELAVIRRHAENNDFIADGGHIWRLSARTSPAGSVTQQDIFKTVEAQAAQSAQKHGVSIYCTGIAPLVELAQQNIFWGFWQSVLMACGLITLIMMGCLRSFWAGLIAMFPNVTPILVVFGLLGWFGVATDIGTMMTGSIALGIAVDGTFHFLTRYREIYSETNDTKNATRQALVETGPPIIQATLVTGFGMLALSISNFVPTARFGLLMAASLGFALIGDLILLPCLLFLRPSTKENVENEERPAAINHDETIDESDNETLLEFPMPVPAPHHQPDVVRVTNEVLQRNEQSR